MHTVRIISKCQPTNYENSGIPITLNGNGQVQEIKVLYWLEIKKISGTQISGGFIYPENVDDEKRVIATFREEEFSKFESMGVSAVKVATKSGDFCKGVLHSLAEEWLLSKDEAQRNENLSISREANAIAKTSSERTNKIAIFAILFTFLATVIAALIAAR
jgi:hypothetical protein